MFKLYFLFWTHFQKAELYVRKINSPELGGVTHCCNETAAFHLLLSGLIYKNKVLYSRWIDLSSAAEMSSVLYLRDFISERLTAAAEEIFSEFEKTIVQYEEQLDRQRRLLDVSWKPPAQLQPAGRRGRRAVGIRHSSVLRNLENASVTKQRHREPETAAKLTWLS